MGLPLGCAEVGAVLWGQEMSYNPDDPTWLNRDRFILSAGHGSMFLYSWLHIAGYDLPKEEVSNFRVKDSKTPGHPEWQGMHPHTPGIESTTGPLGQGIGNGVGMAAAAKQAAATLNTADHTIIDHHVVVLCGDGCLQEGVANEAVAFAGHEKLDNLILMYDSNGVTLDKMAEHTQSEDVSMRFEAQGWEVRRPLLPSPAAQPAAAQPAAAKPAFITTAAQPASVTRPARLPSPPPPSPPAALATGARG